MNFELETLFKFQSLISDMQRTSIGIKDTETRGKAIERIDSLIEIYKTFSSFYYNAHFAEQSILRLQHDKLELQAAITDLQSEVEKLKAELAWGT